MRLMDAMLSMLCSEYGNDGKKWEGNDSNRTPVFERFNERLESTIKERKIERKADGLGVC